MKRYLYTVMLLLGISMSIVSCGEKEPDTIPVSGVSLDKTSIEVVEGDSFSLTPTITPNDATNKRVIWSSSNESVATVNNGSVTTHKAGTVTITVKTEDGNRTATCSVIVKEKTIPVTGVSLDKTSAEITEGESLTLTATITPENASNKNIQWRSSDESVATVSNGRITGKKEGTAEIIASIESVSAKCVITVNKKIIHVESISISTDKKRLRVGETYSIECDVYPDNANNYKLLYSSEDDSIVSVDNKGILTAKNSGKTLVKVKAEDKEALISVTVFKNDDLYYSYGENWAFSKLTNWIYHNNECLFSQEYFRIIDFYVINQTLSIVGYEGNNRPPSKSVIIKDGVKYYLNELDYTNNNHIYSSKYANDKLYLVVNYPKLITNGGYGIWIDKDKKFDISESGVLSEYSIVGVTDLAVVGNDVYSCGFILEPIDENKRQHYGVVWKNGVIYKKYSAADKYSLLGIINMNNELLIALKDERGIISIWNNDTLLYDIKGLEEVSNGDIKLYCFDSKLYLTTIYYVDGKSYFRVYEGGKLLFEIQDVYSYSLDYIDGDLYCLLVKDKKIGGEYYASVHIYRNDKEEKVIVKPQIGAFVSIGIKVINKD